MPKTRGVAHTRIVAYDIADNRRRRRVAKTLEDYGIRTQKSVFLCQLPDTIFERMWRELADIVDDDDSLLAFSICGRCAKRGRTLGKPTLQGSNSNGYVV
jgi:CRISPR-associated protein Cas2